MGVKNYDIGIVARERHGHRPRYRHGRMDTAEQGIVRKGMRGASRKKPCRVGAGT